MATTPPLLTTLPAALLSQALRLDGSWTALLHSSTSATASVTLAYSLLYPDRQLSAECCPFCLPVALRGDARHYRSLSCCQPLINQAVHAVLRVTEHAMLSCAPATKWLDHSQLPALFKNTNPPSTVTLVRYPLLQPLRWPFTIDLDTSTSSPSHAADPALTALHLGMRACTFPAAITYLPDRQLIPSDQAQRIEAAKVIPLVQLRILINELARAKLQTLSSRPAPPDDTLDDDLDIPERPDRSLQQCSALLCSELVTTPHLRLCGPHTHQRRVTCLCDELARILCDPKAALGQFTPSELLARFLVPRSASEYSRTWIWALQNRLTGQLKNSSSKCLWIRKGSEAAVDHTLDVLRQMHLPFLLNSGSTTKLHWQTQAVFASLCHCPELVAPQYSAIFPLPTAHLCAQCRGISIVCIAPDTSVPICLACNLPLASPSTQCHICRRSSHCSPLPPTCTASPELFLPQQPPSLDWTCPHCQMAIAVGFASLRCGRADQLVTAIPRPPRTTTTSTPSSKRKSKSTLTVDHRRAKVPKRASRTARIPCASASRTSPNTPDIPIITTAQRESIEEALRQPPDTTFKARTREEKVTPAVLRNLLNGSGWLTNIELDAAANMLHHDLLVREPDSSAVFYRTSFYPDVRRYATAEAPTTYFHCHSLAVSGLNIFGAHQLFFPINFSNTHWALLYVSPINKTVTYLDSLDVNGRGPTVITTIQYYLQAEAALLLPTLLVNPYVPKEWSFLLPPTTAVPQQTNCSDCGVFLYQFMHNIIHGKPFDQVSPHHTLIYRAQMAFNILTGTFIYTVPDPRSPDAVPVVTHDQLPL